MSKFWEKVNKSEFYVALASLAAVIVAPQLGMSEEATVKVILGVLSMAGVYTAGRSYAKPREELAKAGKPEPSSGG